MVTRYRLFGILHCSFRAGLIFKIENLRIDNTLDLGGVRRDDVLIIDQVREANGNISLVRQACLRGEGENRNGNSVIRGRFGEDFRMMIRS